MEHTTIIALFQTGACAFVSLCVFVGGVGVHIYIYMGCMCVGVRVNMFCAMNFLHP